MMKTVQRPSAALLWQRPSLEILPDPAPQTRTPVYTGASLAEGITACGVPCAFVSASHGAAVSQYHFNLGDLRDIKKLPAVVKMLSASVHHEVTQQKSSAGHFSLVVPKAERETVSLKHALRRDFNFANGINYDILSNYGTVSVEKAANNRMHNALALIPNLRACLGAGADGGTLCLDIEKLPHALISGATGSGKSVLLHSMLTSLLINCTPDRLQLVLIDAKMVELTAYEGIPHLSMPVVTESERAVSVLEDLCRLMDSRYTEMSRLGAKDMPQHWPRLVVVVDELADLMLLSRKSVETSLVRLAQKGRSCGIHLLLATQSPKVQVLTGLLRANIPVKIALKTATAIDSRIALGANGAETLLGRGDGLIQGLGDTIRFQSALTSPGDIAAVVNHWRFAP